MDDDRLEVDLRDALHHEMATARVGVTVPQVRGQIAAREQNRRNTRLAGLAMAAILVVAVAVPLLGGGISTPAGPASAAEPADVVALDTASGDLVVTRAWADGRRQETARYPGAADLLRQATGDLAADLPTDAVATRGPGGRLAIALSQGDVLVFPAPGGGRQPFRVAGAGAKQLTWVGWAPDGRLVVVGNGLIRLVDPSNAAEASRTLPANVMPDWNRADGSILLTWTDDGRVLARRSRPSTFSSEIGTLDVTADQPEFSPGLPAGVRAVTGLEARQAPDGSEPAGWAKDGIRTDQAGMAPSGDVLPRVAWYVARPGEQLVDTARAADGRGLLVLATSDDGTGGRLLAADAVGSWRDAVSLAAASDGPWLIRGVAPGRRTIAVSTGDRLHVADVTSGAASALPAGTLFLSWPTVSEVATETLAGIWPCATPAANSLAAAAMSGAGSISPASSGALPVLGTRGDVDPWRRGEAASATPVQVDAGSELVLALHPSTCVDAWHAEAVPVVPGDAAPLELGSLTAGGSNPIAGLLGFDAPPAGAWIVRVTLWARGAPTEAVLLYRVNVGPAGPVPTSPAPPTPAP